MTPDQIFAVVAALLTGEPDPDFDRLREGGFDDRYAVEVQSCELPPGTLEVEGRTLLCGTVSVPENYDAPNGRRVPLEFETRSNQAALAIADKEARAALVRDYALLQTAEPTAATLVGWIMRHFTDADRDNLLQLVAAMSDADIERTFAIVDSEATTYELILGSEVNQGIYACQEDMPYNTLDGFMARMDELEETYPFMAIFRGETSFYEKCKAFEQQPHSGFNDPVSSDVPVLVLNDVLDIQTSWRWGAVAAETLSNARNYVIPEAGHGAIAYQRCPNDMSVAFINNPTAELDVSCIDRIRIDFLLPDEPFGN